MLGLFTDKNLDCQKWLLNQQGRLEIKILVNKSEFFTLTDFIFITQSEMDVFSFTYPFLRFMPYNVFKIQLLTCGD